MTSAWLKWSLVTLGGAIVAVGAGVATAIAFGTSPPPEPMDSVAELMAKVDYSNMPAPLHFQVHNGATPSYRAYPHDGSHVAVITLRT